MTITEILKSAGVSQRAACQELGIPINTMNQWCVGKRQPPEYIVRLIAEHYGVK